MTKTQAKAKSKSSKPKGEATLLVIKPDGIKKSLTGNILSRLSETKLIIIACGMKSVTRKFAEVHYQHLKGKPFFDDLMKYIMGDYHTQRVMALVYYGPNAIDKIRQVCGATNPEEAEAYSIRGSYGRITTRGVFENVVHASANKEDADREIRLWFRPDDFAYVHPFPSRKAKASGDVKVWS